MKFDFEFTNKTEQALIDKIEPQILDAINSIDITDYVAEKVKGKIQTRVNSIVSNTLSWKLENKIESLLDDELQKLAEQQSKLVIKKLRKLGNENNK